MFPPHCETITLSLAKPDGMGITPAISPGQLDWPGFFRAAKRRLPQLKCRRAPNLMGQRPKNSENTQDALIFKAMGTWVVRAIARTSLR